MNYFQERFGFKEVRLSPNEKGELKKELKTIDNKRIHFFAFVGVFVSCIFLILDLFFYAVEFQSVYVIFDAFLLSTSIFIVLRSAQENEIKLRRSRLDQIIHIVYPAIMLAWATGIASLNPGSVFNIVTFYIVVFLIAFALVIPFKTFIFYYLVVLSVYSLVAQTTGQSFFSEMLALLSAGVIVTFPFYQTFLSARINSHAAIIKLNRSNRDLETEVNKSINELRQINEDLQNEITHRKIVQQKLKNALTKAETSDKLKSEFLANISHEVRTPLNAIIGFTEMMTENGATPKQKEEFQKLIASNTMYLLSTFDDIFDASYVRTEQYAPVFKPIELDKFLDNIEYEVAGLNMKYDKPEVNFKLEKPNQHLSITSDDFLLKKAIMRLLDNAYKFTSEGQVTIGAKLTNNNQLKVWVSDTGIGIKTTDHDKIFEPFVQGDGSFSRGYGGSGLGLTIVKGITDALNIELKIDSTPAKGSTFTLLFAQKVHLKD